MKTSELSRNLLRFYRTVSRTSDRLNARLLTRNRVHRVRSATTVRPRRAA